MDLERAELALRSARRHQAKAADARDTALAKVHKTLEADSLTGLAKAALKAEQYCAALSVAKTQTRLLELLVEALRR